MNYNKEILNISNLTVKFNSFGSEISVFDNFTLPTINESEWIFLIGKNGSGKSTLFNVITGKNKDFQGDVEFFGENINSLSHKEKSKLFFLINQNPMSTTVDELTVLENLTLTIGDFVAKEKFTNILKEVGLEKHIKHLVKNLSGGQRQILALLIAKYRKTKLLLLDEPFAALDPNNVSIATEVIKDLWKSGTTIFFITHDMEYIENINIEEIKVFNLSEM